MQYIGVGLLVYSSHITSDPEIGIGSQSVNEDEYDEDELSTLNIWVSNCFGFIGLFKMFMLDLKDFNPHSFI